MNHPTTLSAQRCELCGMLAVAHQKDAHGVVHHYCEHHVPEARNQKSNIKNQKEHTDHHQHQDFNKHAGHSVDMFRVRFWWSLVLTIPVVAYSKGLQELFGFHTPEFAGSGWIPLVFGSVVFFYGGTVFLKSAWGELKARLPGMMSLISLAIIAAYLYSLATSLVLAGTEFFWELTTLITVMLLGHWMEMKSVMGAQGALKELAKLLPDEAEKIRSTKSEIRNTETETVPIAELKIGDFILIRPGGKVPADGIIVEGESDLNEAMLTGESKPVEKKQGDKVIAGTVNGAGSLVVKVEKIGENTALSGIMRLVAEAQSSKSRTQMVADRAAFYLTLIAIAVGTLTLLGWLLFSDRGAAFAMERTVTVLVIACPHALGLAVPLVTAISTSLSARNGLLVRQRMALEAARNIDVVLFDKTGTLTTGEFGVSRVIAADGNEKEITKLAAAVEHDSQHFLGKSIVAYSEKLHQTAPKATLFKSLAGKGVQATVGGKAVLVGGPQLLDSLKLAVPDAIDKQVAQSAQGKTVVYVILEKSVAGAIILADAVRAESKEAVKALQALGVRVAMLTGDSEDVAKSVAQELGIKDYFAQVLPEHKVDKVKELQKTGRVAMVGDGVNDAPALIQANVGIAIGAGTDVAIESAGIILVKNDPRDVVKVIKLSRATYRKMVQNLVWATGYNLVAIPLAAGVLAFKGILLAPALGAVLMSLSTVIVAFNAQLLRRLNLQQ